jgi:endonuclease-8
MPEGPSLVILCEETQGFVGRRVVAASGNSSVIDPQRLVGQQVHSIRSWGKHFLIEFDGFSLRVHFLLFGSYRINERKDSAPRLSLTFDQGELNFYACSVEYIEQPLETRYDWRTDIMSQQWSATLALKKLRAMPTAWVCDAVLDQTVFAGAGNIFKNEVLFRIRVHPLSQVGALSPGKLRQLVTQMRVYGGEFLVWKKAFILRKQWLAHSKSTCPRCRIPFSRGHLGKTKRRSFFCERCQKLYVLGQDSGPAS